MQELEVIYIMEQKMKLLPKNQLILIMQYIDVLSMPLNIQKTIIVKKLRYVQKQMF